MKSAATRRRSTPRLLVLGAALLGLAWCVVLASRPPAPSVEQTPAVKTAQGVNLIPAQPNTPKPAAQGGVPQPQGVGPNRAQQGHAQLRVYLAEPAGPLSQPLQIALLRGDSILEVTRVSKDRPGVFSIEPQAALVLALEETTLPDWAVGPRAQANAGPGLHEWTAVQRVDWSHQVGLEVELSLVQASELLVMVWGPDGEPVSQATVQMTTPSTGGEVLPMRTRTDDNGTLHLRHAHPGLYEFAPIYAPGGGAVSAPTEKKLSAGQSSALTIVLEEAKSSLSGTVVDQWDKPVATASLTVSWGNWALRTAKTDSEGRFTVEGLPQAPVTLSLQERTASALSVLYPKEIEQGFEPVTVTPTRDLGELQVIRPAPQTAKVRLVDAQPEDLVELRVFITPPFDAKPTWKELLKRQNRELQVSDDGAIEYLAPRTKQEVQITVWKEDVLVGDAITTHESSSATDVRIIQP